MKARSTEPRSDGSPARLPGVPAVAPSLLSADFAHLADEIRAVEEGGARLLHLDVMDGHFVPNLTIGIPVVESLRRVTRLPFDVHLMIQEPDRYLERFVRAGAGMISVHQETVPHLQRTVAYIRECGAAAGVALNPATPITTLQEILHDLDYVLLMTVNPGFGGQRLIPSTLPKVARLRRMIEESGSKARIEVDGGVDATNIRELHRQGAEIFVAGSAIFGGGKARERTRALVDRLQRSGRSA